MYMKQVGGYCMQDFNDIISLLDEINNDKTVPKNIRTAISSVKDDLKDNRLEKTVKTNRHKKSQGKEYCFFQCK